MATLRVLPSLSKSHGVHSAKCSNNKSFRRDIKLLVGPGKICSWLFRPSDKLGNKPSQCPKEPFSCVCLNELQYKGSSQSIKEAPHFLNQIPFDVV